VVLAMCPLCSDDNRVTWALSYPLHPKAVIKASRGAFRLPTEDASPRSDSEIMTAKFCS
jgi:hypothetical protein